MRSRRSVGQLLGVIVVANLVIVLLIGLVGSLSVLGSTRSVNYLSNDLAGAVRSNNAVLVDLLDAETNLRGYVISGDASSLAGYQAAAARVGPDLRPLVAYADAHDDHLASVIAREKTAWRAWLRSYADAQASSGGGAGTFDTRAYARGARLFAAIRDSNATVRTRLAGEQQAASRDATRRLHATLTLIGLGALIGALILLLLSGWIANQVRRPLSRLAGTVQRLAEGHHDARAVVAGPREIHRVAQAVNQLAEENERSRALESQIQAQLREIDTVKTEFVANVSHELRTPLTIITGYLELFEEELTEDLDDEQSRMLDVTQRNVRRLRELIEDLLALTQAENPSADLEPVELGAVVAEVAKDVRLSATGQGVTVTLTCDPDDDLVVLADASQLQRSVVNLVGNAIKFSSSGSEVRMSVVRLGEGAAQVSVVDDGMGIPSAELPKLGSRFFRASNAVAGEIAGTGLGLRIVQTIVQHHHGTLEISSVEGQGTAAVIRLPLYSPDPCPSDRPSDRSCDRPERDDEAVPGWEERAPRSG